MRDRVGWSKGSVIAAASVLALVSIVEAHHAPVMFDRETPVSVSGTVIRFEFSAPHSFLLVEQQTPDGTVEWAIEGPSPIQLRGRGMGEDTFAHGDAIEACGYTLKQPATTGKYAEKTVLLAEIMVMPDNEVLLWSPYGNAQCREQKGYVVGGR